MEYVVVANHQSAPNKHQKSVDGKRPSSSFATDRDSAKHLSYLPLRRFHEHRLQIKPFYMDKYPCP
jgi:hypothetical protein